MKLINKIKRMIMNNMLVYAALFCSTVMANSNSSIIFHEAEAPESLKRLRKY